MFLYNESPNCSKDLYSYDVYYVIMSSQLNHIAQWISISVEHIDSIKSLEAAFDLKFELYLNY